MTTPSPPSSPPHNKLKRTIYTGTFISTPTPTTLEVLESHAVAVDENGVITHSFALPRKGGAEGEGEGGDAGHEHVAGWVERNWGGVIGDGWELVGAGKGWWFPGFVGECASFLWL